MRTSSDWSYNEPFCVSPEIENTSNHLNPKERKFFKLKKKTFHEKPKQRVVEIVHTIRTADRANAHDNINCFVTADRFKNYLKLSSSSILIVCESSKQVQLKQIPKW